MNPLHTARYCVTACLFSRCVVSRCLTSPPFTISGRVFFTVLWFMPMPVARPLMLNQSPFSLRKLRIFAREFEGGNSTVRRPTMQPKELTMRP